MEDLQNVDEPKDFEKEIKVLANEREQTDLMALSNVLLGVSNYWGSTDHDFIGDEKIADDGIASRNYIVLTSLIIIRGRFKFNCFINIRRSHRPFWLTTKNWFTH